MVCDRDFKFVLRMSAVGILLILTAAVGYGPLQADEGAGLRNAELNPTEVSAESLWRESWTKGDYKGAIAILSPDLKSRALETTTGNRNGLTGRLALDSYHLGTLHLLSDEPGEAVAWLSYSDSLIPGNDSTTRNLSLARSKLAARIGTEELEPGQRTWLKSVSDELLGLTAQFLGVFFAALALGMTAWRISSATSSSPAGIGVSWNGGILLGAAALLFFAGLTWRSQANGSRFAVLEPLVARSGPGETYVELAKLSPGILLKLDSNEGSAKGWLKVRLSQGRKAWIPSKSALPLSKRDP
jgi:hypothetical protein